MKDIKSQKRMSSPIDGIDFNCLSMSSLQNYANKYGVSIPDNAMHNEVADIVKKHFLNLYVDEDQVISSFVHRIDEIGKNKDITSSPLSIGEHRRTKKPKKYGEEYSLARILEDNAEDIPKETVKTISEPTDDSVQYCICGNPSNDEMIACDNENCRVKWYHYECAKVDPHHLPDKWYCEECAKLGVARFVVC